MVRWDTGSAGYGLNLAENRPLGTFRDLDVRRKLDATAWAPYTESEIESQRAVLIMTVTVKNKTRTPLVVPPSVRRRAGHRNGEDLEFRVSGGVITIAPKRPAADDEYTPEQRRRIDRGIDQSLKEYAEGKGAGPFATAEEFLDDLHRASARLGAKKAHRVRK